MVAISRLDFFRYAPPGTASRRVSLMPHDPQFEHSRGTIAIVVIFGVLFGLGWLAMYFYRFMATGAPHH